MVPFFNPPTPTDSLASGPSQEPTPHPFVVLARDAIRAYLEDARVIAPPAALFDRFVVLRHRFGAFVTLKKGGELRGCIGTFEPMQVNLAVEIIENAMSAGFRDPRFPPLAREEFATVSVSVDVLKPPEAIASVAELDPSRYGIIVRQGSRHGLLLPAIEDVTSVQDQIDIACRKGGIDTQNPYDMYRFVVDRYH